MGSATALTRKSTAHRDIIYHQNKKMHKNIHAIDFEAYFRSKPQKREACNDNCIPVEFGRVLARLAREGLCLSIGCHGDVARNVVRAVEVTWQPILGSNAWLCVKAGLKEKKIDKF